MAPSRHHAKEDPIESRIEMSQHERDVLAVMNRVLLSERQVRRIQRRLEAEGDGAVVHRLGGRPSNRQLSGKLRERVLEVYEKKLSDFGPTLASEVLEERGLIVSPWFSSREGSSRAGW